MSEYERFEAAVAALKALPEHQLREYLLARFGDDAAVPAEPLQLHWHR